MRIVLPPQPATTEPLPAEQKEQHEHRTANDPGERISIAPKQFMIRMDILSQQLPSVAGEWREKRGMCLPVNAEQKFCNCELVEDAGREESGQTGNATMQNRLHCL